MDYSDLSTSTFSTIKKYKRTEWTNEENILFLDLIKKNLSFSEMREHFPQRTIVQIRSHYNYFKNNINNKTRLGVRGRPKNKEKRNLMTNKKQEIIDSVNISLVNEKIKRPKTKCEFYGKINFNKVDFPPKLILPASLNPHLGISSNPYLVLVVNSDLMIDTKMILS